MQFCLKAINEVKYVINRCLSLLFPGGLFGGVLGGMVGTILGGGIFISTLYFGLLGLVSGALGGLVRSR